MKKNNNTYKQWLFNILGDPSGAFREVLSIMFAVRFYEVIPNDANRIGDGLELRNEYETEYQKPAQTENDDCSVLEMMIGLSRRINSLAYDYMEPDKTAYWFWLMFDNLELNRYPGAIDYEQETRIASILYDFVERDYSPNGHGGLFPMYPAPFDCRSTEIWYQMQAWIVEHV